MAERPADDSIMQQTITGRVTYCRCDRLGRIDGIGGDGWLLEAELVAADIVAAQPGPGPYFITSTTGEAHWLTVQKDRTGRDFELSTTEGHDLLMVLPAQATPPS